MQIAEICRSCRSALIVKIQNVYKFLRLEQCIVLTMLTWLVPHRRGCEVIYELVQGHRPVIVKRAVIGSKGGWKLSSIFLSCRVFHDWPIIKLGNIFNLSEGYIFAALFEATSHCFC